MSETQESQLSNWRDNESWNLFFTQFSEYLKSLAYSYKLPSQDVDDVVQEVFISMANYFRKNKFDSNKGNIYSWVTTFAKWRMVDIIRRNQRQNKHVTSGDELLMEMQPDESQDLETILENKYQEKLFLQAFQNIGRSHKNKDYMIFYDMHFNDLNNDELMSKYKINSGAIYIAKHRMIKRLKEEISNILCAEPNY
jgi:RNA polymerase sigma-70 factor (ECF subfamily)